MRYTWTTIDFVIVLLFVGIGRSVHDHGVNIAGMASTTWPFAVGLATAWLALVAWRRSGISLTDGVVASVATVLVAMTLRVLSGQGTAAPFVVVAMCFLGSFMVGWRAALALVRRMRGSKGTT